MTQRLFLLMAFFVVIGCKKASSLPTTPTKFENFLEAATQAAISNTATETPILPISSPYASEIAEAEVLFRDDFDSKLKSEWSFVNENVEDWSLNIKPGFLQIDAIGGYFNLGNASNVLLRPAPEGDFMIETSLLFDPEASDQFAGLIALESNKNFLQAGIGYCPQNAGCSKRGFNIDVYIDGKLTLPRNTTSVPDEKIMTRLIFIDDSFQIFTSFDSITWYRILEQKFEFDIHQVGLIAAQNNDADPDTAIVDPETAVFDYFQISTIAP